MKHKIINRVMSLFLALVCVMGLLPLSAFAAGLSTAPGSITQKSSDYMKIGGQSVRYRAASSVINNVGLPYVFDEQVEVPGFGATRALCAYQKGTLGPAANGQKWNYKNEVDNASLKVLLTYVYSHTYGNFTDAGNAIGLEHWNQYWSDIWFMVAQAMSWYYEHGIILDVNSNREGFIEQAAEEFVAAMKLYHRTYGQSSFITNWDAIDTHSIIDSADGGATGYSAYDYIATGVNLVLDHPEYYNNYHLWMYEWDSSQPWKLVGQSGVPMQKLLIAVPDEEEIDRTLPGLRLLKLDRQTNKPIPNVTFKIEEVDGGFTDQRQTDKDGVIFWENLRPGAYKVWEVTPAPNYVHDDTVHVVQLEPNHTTTIELTNIEKPTLKVLKVDSITKSPIANVKFQIWRGSDDTITGELNDLGIHYTNASGEIVLEHIDTGWYRIKELEPAPGFTIKAPDTQDIYLKAGETHVVQFENVPKNAIVVEKYDSVTHEALAGCTFQLRYLAGTSGTGGTVIGQKVTGANGIAMWTGLEPGAYVIEEVDPADGYSIINSSETVFIADNGEQSVVTVRFDNSPDGNLLIRKVCATNPSVTLQNAEFKVTYADGTLIGDSNGIYRTDENGEIRIEGLKPGKSVVVTEVRAPAGFILDTQSQTIQIKEGRTVSLTFKNQPKG